MLHYYKCIFHLSLTKSNILILIREYSDQSFFFLFMLCNKVKMLLIIKEKTFSMPLSWTLVQITSGFVDTICEEGEYCWCRTITRSFWETAAEPACLSWCHCCMRRISLCLSLLACSFTICHPCRGGGLLLYHCWIDIHTHSLLWSDWVDSHLCRIAEG